MHKIIDYRDGISYRKVSPTALLVTLPPGQHLYFVGKANVTVLKGIVEILGHELDEKDPPRSVYSPKGHSSLLCITGVSSQFLEDSATSRDSFSELDFLENDQRPFQNLISLEELGDLEGAGIIMEGFESTWCEGIRRYGSDGWALVGPKISGIGSGKTPELETLMNKVGFQFPDPDDLGTRRLFCPSLEWVPAFESVCQAFDTGKAQ